MCVCENRQSVHQSLSIWSLWSRLGLVWNGLLCGGTPFPFYRPRESDGVQDREIERACVCLEEEEEEVEAISYLVICEPRQPCHR